MLTAGSVPQFGDGLVFDLPDPFPCKAEVFADIFQAHRMI